MQYFKIQLFFEKKSLQRHSLTVNQINFAQKKKIETN